MTRSRGHLRRFVRRNRSLVAVALVATITSSGTAVAATALYLGVTNTSSTSTTLKSGVNGAVLQLTNTNSTGGTSARGLGITVPAGRSPITVNSTAGKATNLNADKLDGIDSTGFVRGPAQAWREIGAAGQPAFAQFCGPIGCPPIWFHYGPDYNTAAFYKDPLGVVWLKGLVRANALDLAAGCDALKIFVLPAGYRPAKITIFATLRNSAPARLDILPDGSVALCGPTEVHVDDWWLLDGIAFRAAQ